MKHLPLLAACLFFMPPSTHAQPKNDYIWLFGYPNDVTPPIPYYGGTILDFHATPREVTWFDIPIWFRANCVLGDEEGNLLFYTNGCEIRNWAHQLVQGGDGINPGDTYSTFCTPNYGYPTLQGTLALPDPDEGGRHYLFHLRQNDDNIELMDSLLLTTLEFLGPTDSGRVLAKNEPLLGGSFSDQLTAVRHGNGRDWWVVQPRRASDVYDFLLLGPGGPVADHDQATGMAFDSIDWVGQAAFSPDGSRYARISAENGIHLYHFDRCSGLLSDPQHIGLWGDTLVAASGTGLSFSPSSRYLYASVRKKVYQYDLEAPDVAASKVMVAYYDGYETLGVIPNLFYQQMLAPDGRIYIVPPGGCDALHVIHAPDEAGTACDLRQHDLPLAALESWGMPNFPHFRTYDLPGSPCDTLGIDAPVVAIKGPEAPVGGTRVFPNPASGHLNIVLDAGTGGLLRLVNASGATVLARELPGGQQSKVSLAGLAPGIYVARIALPDGRVSAHKVVVQ